jgi:hypothetical protein
MRRLKRRHCSVLRLFLAREWYDLIASGKKTEEYREYKAFYHSRIDSWRNRFHDLVMDCHGGYHNCHLVIAFSLGYTKADMFFEGDVINPAVVRERSTRPDWGEPSGKHYVIALAERVELEDEE